MIDKQKLIQLLIGSKDYFLNEDSLFDIIDQCQVSESKDGDIDIKYVDTPIWKEIVYRIELVKKDMDLMDRDIEFLVCGSTALYMYGKHHQMPNDLDIILILNDVDETRSEKWNNFLLRSLEGSSPSFVWNSVYYSGFKIPYDNFTVDVFLTTNKFPYKRFNINGQTVLVQSLECVLQAKAAMKKFDPRTVSFDSNRADNVIFNAFGKVVGSYNSNGERAIQRFEYDDDIPF